MPGPESRAESLGTRECPRAGDKRCPPPSSSSGWWGEPSPPRGAGARGWGLLRPVGGAARPIPSPRPLRSIGVSAPFRSPMSVLNRGKNSASDRLPGASPASRAVYLIFPNSRIRKNDLFKLRSLDERKSPSAQARGWHTDGHGQDRPLPLLSPSSSRLPHVSVPPPSSSRVSPAPSRALLLSFPSTLHHICTQGPRSSARGLRVLPVTASSTRLMERGRGLQADGPRPSPVPESILFGQHGAYTFKNSDVLTWDRCSPVCQSC